MKSFDNSGTMARAADGQEVREDLDIGVGREPAAGCPEPVRLSEETGSPRSRQAATIRSSWIPQIEAAIRKSSDYFFRVGIAAAPEEAGSVHSTLDLMSSDPVWKPASGSALPSGVVRMGNLKRFIVPLRNLTVHMMSSEPRRGTTEAPIGTKSA